MAAPETEVILQGTGGVNVDVDASDVASVATTLSNGTVQVESSIGEVDVPVEMVGTTDINIEPLIVDVNLDPPSQVDVEITFGNLVSTGGGSGTVTSVSVVTANGVSGSVATPTTVPAITITLGDITPTSVAATGAVSGSNLSGTNTGDQTSIVGITGTLAEFNAALTGADFATGGGTVTGASSGTNTGDQTSVSGNAGTATALATGRTIAITGDLAYTSPTFDGTSNVTAAGTLATVNSNVGSFGSATNGIIFTVNGKGLVTAASEVTITPAVGSITGLGTGVATALGVNVGSAGAFVVLNGALGTPSSGVGTNLTALTAANITASTTVGRNVLNLTNPSAVTFLRINADNTVDALNASDFRTAIGAGVGGGDVVGPASATDGAFALFDTTTGKLIKNSSAPGTGVMTALAIAVGNAGAFVTFNGAGGTPSSMVGTNITGTAAGLTAGTASAVAVGGITGLGTGVATALAVNVGSAGAPVVQNGALGTPSSGDAANLTNAVAYGIKTASTTVSVSGATAPTSGQTLVATSSTNATWQTPAGSGDMLKSVYDPQNAGYISGADGDATSPGGSLNMDGGSGTSAQGGSIITSGGTASTAVGGTINTHGEAEEGGSISTYGQTAAGGAIWTMGGTVSSANTGGTIHTYGNASAAGGIIHTHAGSASGTNGGSIETNGGTSTNANGGSIKTIGGAAPGGNIYTYGTSTALGGSILTYGGSGSSASGGTINTSGGTGSSDTGGSINTSGGSEPGGNITTNNGGGSINTTGTGSIELGVAATRTTINGAATAARTLTLPDATGTVALTTDVPPATNFLTGLVITSDATDPTNDIDISAGSARNSADTANMTATALIKQQDAVWAVGTNAGGMYQSAALTGTISTAGSSTTTTGASTTFLTDYVVGDVITDTTGTQSRRITAIAGDTSLTVASAWTVAAASTHSRGGKAANTAYYIYLIRRSDTGVVDVFFTTRNPSQTVNLPTNYDSSRLIGGFHNNGTPAVDGVFNTNGFTASGFQTINYTTTLGTSVDTGLQFYGAANETWSFDFIVPITSPAAGYKFQVTAPTSTTTETWVTAFVGGAVPQQQNITAINTLSANFAAAASVKQRATMLGAVTLSSTAGAIALGVASTTATQTTTVHAKAYFTARCR